MATFNYIGAQNTALGLIQKFGQSITIYRTSSDYDPVTGEVTNSIYSSTPADVVTLPASKGTITGFDNKFVEDLIRGKGRFFYVAATGLTFDPEPGDILAFEGKTWDIAGTTPLNPAGTPVYFTIGCKSSAVEIDGLPVDDVDCMNVVEVEW